jgi:hypothetical protein
MHLGRHRLSLETFDSEALYPLLDRRESPPEVAQDAIDGSQGCLLGQLAGAPLGNLVDFQIEDAIRQK